MPKFSSSSYTAQPKFRMDDVHLPRQEKQAPQLAAVPSSRGLLSGAELRTGCLPRNDTVDQILNRGVAVALLLLLAPMFAVICLLQLATSRGPVFYRGKRLGKNAELFDILKFRTLEDRGQTVTTGKTLPRRSMTETPIGTYLRASRLDELPQLINIARGDMVFFGPRPVRPEMEAIYRAQAPGYEARFMVRPGLVGLAQAVMSHGTPKAVRARFNRMVCRTPVNYFALAQFVVYVGFCVLRKSVAVAFEAIGDLLDPMGEHKWLSAGFRRPHGSTVELDIDGKKHIGAICGVSDEVIQFMATHPFPTGPQTVKLVRKRRDGRLCNAKVKADITTIVPVGVGRSGFVHYATYEATTPFSHHFVERYLLQSAVIPP